MGGAELRTPAFVVDEGLLKRNLELLADVARRAGCKILLAQKAFSMYRCYPLIRQYLAGSTASGLYEARLGREEFGGEVHVFKPAYTEAEFEALLEVAAPAGGKVRGPGQSRGQAGGPAGKPGAFHPGGPRHL